MSKRKYRKGLPYFYVDDLIRHLDLGSGFCYINDKILHRGWVYSLQFRYIKKAVDQRRVYEAIKIKKDGE